MPVTGVEVHLENARQVEPAPLHVQIAKVRTGVLTRLLLRIEHLPEPGFADVGKDPERPALSIQVRLAEQVEEHRVRLVRGGVTSLEEVMRVVDLTDRLA